MAGIPTNPSSGLELVESMSTEALRPRNNGADIPNRATFLSNLGVTATAAELNAIDGIATTVTVTAVAGASNVSTVTVTVKDASGATVTGVHLLDLWTASDAAGTTISTTAYSGTLAADTGTILETLIAKHHFAILTASTGIWAGSLTDTAKTADYIAVKKPLGAGIVVSSAAAYGA